MAIDAPDAERDYLYKLIDHLRPSRPSGPDAVTSLLGRIAVLVGGHAALVAPDGSMTGNIASPVLSGVRYSPSSLRVRDGELSAASLVQGGHYIHLIGIGEQKPRPVFVVARRTPYTAGAAKLISGTAFALAAYDRLARTKNIEGQLAQALPTARAAVLLQLLAGDVEGARKLAEPLVPGLLDAPVAQIFILECPAAIRTSVFAACQRAVGGRALATAIPSSDSRIAVLAPASSPQGAGDVGKDLRQIAEDFECFMGESRPVSLERVRHAHQMATEALAVAPRLPGRAAVYNGEQQLAHLLCDRSRAWAEEVLKPLDVLADGERRELIGALEEVVRHGQSAAAQRLGLNRKTVAARCARAQCLLGVNLSDMRSRAELDLALQILQLSARKAPSAPCVSLSDILMSPTARAWAQNLVLPLREDARPLLRTVRTWIACNGRVKVCAQLLNTHHNTVRNHLAACEELLGRRLVGRRGGATDLVMALRILEEGAPAAQPAT